MALQTLDYYYCTQTQIEQALSVAGVLLRVDDDADGTIDSGVEADSITDARIEATETVNYYCWSKYTPARLSESNWVNRQAVALAAYAICSRRGNPPPQIIVERAEKAEEMLKAVADKGRVIPNLPMRRSLAPDVINQRVDARFQWKVLRVEKDLSTKRASALPVVTDWLSAAMYEI